MKTKMVLVAVTLLASSASHAAPFSRVDTDLAAHDAHVATARATFDQLPADPHDKVWVKKKLEHMVDVDQYVRTYGEIVYTHGYTSDEAAYFWKQLGARMNDVDDADRDLRMVQNRRVRSNRRRAGLADRSAR